jgi:hypothetical protein
MTGAQFQAHLDHLQLEQDDAAALLLVTPLTVRRWQNGDLPVPDAVAQRLRAWRQLVDAQLPWAAELRSVRAEDLDNQIRRHGEHDVALASVLRRVAARGGPSRSWQIDFEEATASLSHMTVHFVPRQDGGFSLASYWRQDIHPDVERDQYLVDDAVVAFAMAVRNARTTRPGQYWHGAPIVGEYAIRVTQKDNRYP